MVPKMEITFISPAGQLFIHKVNELNFISEFTMADHVFKDSRRISTSNTFEDANLVNNDIVKEEKITYPEYSGT